MVVVVARVCGVTMTIVDVVDVVAVGDGDVAAALAVDVIVAGVLGVSGGLAFVEVTVVGPVEVAVVRIVDVGALGDLSPIHIWRCRRAT